MNSRIEKETFGNIVDATGNEQEVHLFSFRTQKGLIIKISSYGASLNSVKHPDKCGKLDHVILGFENAKEYLKFNFIGSSIGRCGNRIKKGKFTLNNFDYQLVINNNSNHLHGGSIGWDKYVWSSSIDGGKLTFSLLSPDGDQGYPGAVIPQVTYSLDEDGSLHIDYQAVSTKATPINMTNHAFFNLAGHGAGQKGLFEHVVQVDADRYIPISEDLIPTGELPLVAGTGFDLTSEDTFEHLLSKVKGNGFDHCFCAKDKKRGQLERLAKFHHPPSGRILEVFTTEPGAQIYTGNFIPKEEGKMVGRGGVSYTYQGAFCCEPQNYPDAINHANFPSSVLQPGEIYRHSIVFKFTTEC